MAEPSTDRPPSVSSSVTEAGTFDDSEKASSLSTAEGRFTKLHAPEDVGLAEAIERAGLLSEELQEVREKPQSAGQGNSTTTAIMWMVVNTLATIGIVSSSTSKREPQS
jgi:solute carrier family 35 protein E3